MGGHQNRRIGYLILLLIICGLLGGLLGEAIGQNVNALGFMKNYITIGMKQPLVISLKLVSLTFALSFNVNILSLVGMMMGYFIYKKM